MFYSGVVSSSLWYSSVAALKTRFSTFQGIESGKEMNHFNLKRGWITAAIADPATSSLSKMQWTSLIKFILLYSFG